MKFRTLIALGLTASSLNVSAICVTGDLANDTQQISAMNLSAESKRVLTLESARAKLSEVLACSASREQISATDAQFAISFLQQEQTEKIIRLQQKEQKLRRILQNVNSEDGKSGFQFAVNDIPVQLSGLLQETKILIAHILQNTKN